MAVVQVLFYLVTHISLCLPFELPSSPEVLSLPPITSDMKRDVSQDDPFSLSCFSSLSLCYQWTKLDNTAWFFTVRSKSRWRTIFFLVYSGTESGIQFFYPEEVKLRRTPTGAPSFRVVVPAYSNVSMIAATVETAYSLSRSTLSYYSLSDFCNGAGCFSEVVNSDLTGTSIYVNSSYYAPLNYYIASTTSRNAVLTTFPYVIQLAPFSTSTLLATTLANNDYDYWYTNYKYEWRYGENIGNPANYLYGLPINSSYTAMVPYRFLTNVPYSNAVFFKIPEGTPVYSSRGGLVIATRDDQLYSYFSGSCPTPVLLNCSAYSIYTNYVLIGHDDGSYMFYSSLLKDSVRVKAGQMITQGALLGRSGNTGYTPNGPVLVLQLQSYLPFPPFYDFTGDTLRNHPITFDNNGEPLIIQPTVDSGPSVGMIAGIVAGSVCALILLGVIIRCLASPKAPPPSAASQPTAEFEATETPYMEGNAQHPPPPVTISQVTTTVIQETIIPPGTVYAQPQVGVPNDYAAIYGEYYAQNQ